MFWYYLPVRFFQEYMWHWELAREEFFKLHEMEPSEIPEDTHPCWHSVRVAGRPICDMFHGFGWREAYYMPFIDTMPGHHLVALQKGRAAKVLS